MIESELLKSAQAGDRAAMEAVLAAIAPRLRRFGTRLCASFAEDALQDSLLKVAQELPKFRGESELSSWAFAIVRSSCARLTRGKINTHTSLLSDIEEEGSHQEDPERALLHLERKEAFGCALQSLDFPLREVLLLRDIEELSAKETARVLGLTVAAVKSRLHRGRRALSVALDEQLREGVLRKGCPDVYTLASQAQEGELSEAGCQELKQHLSECKGCDAACARLKKAIEDCRTR